MSFPQRLFSSFSPAADAVYLQEREFIFFSRNATLQIFFSPLRNPRTTADVRGVSCCVGTACCTRPQPAACSVGAPFTEQLIHVDVGVYLFYFVVGFFFPSLRDESN